MQKIHLQDIENHICNLPLLQTSTRDKEGCRFEKNNNSFGVSAFRVFIVAIISCEFPFTQSQTIIDWVDVIMWNDTTYHYNYQTNELKHDWETGANSGK